MIVNTSDLKTFLKAASVIDSGSILPVHSFVLLSNGLMMKVNNSQFVKFTSDFKGECLVDEKLLNTFVNHSKSETITLKISGKSITISDGLRSVKGPTDDVANFHIPVTTAGESILFDEQTLKAIGQASKFVQDIDELLPVKKHVFIGNNCIIGTNGQIGFKYFSELNLPSVVLSKGEAKLMGSMSNCEFSYTPHWHFFKDGSVVYGWIKSEANFVDLRTVFKESIPDFTLSRSELLAFLDHAVSSTVGNAVVGSFEGVSGRLNLWVRDKSFDIDVSQSIAYDGLAVPIFGFGPVLFQQLVKAFPADTYAFSSGQNIYYLNSGNTTCLIMEMK